MSFYFSIKYHKNINLQTTQEAALCAASCVV